MEATVATARTFDAISQYDDPHRWAWRRNRVSNLVVGQFEAVYAAAAYQPSSPTISSTDHTWSLTPASIAGVTRSV
jgi:hypothetical protein